MVYCTYIYVWGRDGQNPSRHPSRHGSRDWRLIPFDCHMQKKEAFQHCQFQPPFSDPFRGWESAAEEDSCCMMLVAIPASREKRKRTRTKPPSSRDRIISCHLAPTVQVATWDHASWACLHNQESMVKWQPSVSYLSYFAITDVLIVERDCEKCFYFDVTKAVVASSSSSYVSASEGVFDERKGDLISPEMVSQCESLWLLVHR